MSIASVPARTIVVGVDGSASANEALRWAVDQAVLEQRDLTVVHAVPPEAAYVAQPWITGGAVPAPRLGEGRVILEHASDLVRHRLQTLADRQAPSTGRGPRVRLLLREADPRAALVELSRDAALVVLGSRGRGAVRSLLLGSVGLGVSDRAACPVVVHRPHRAGVVRRGILVGVDGTERSLPALEFAYRQASRQGLPLTVMHCYLALVGAYVGPRHVTAAEDAFEDSRVALAETVAGMGEAYPDVPTEMLVARGRPEDCLVEESERMHMVVVGSEPMDRFSELVLGDVSRRVVEHARGVVAVVPAGDTPM